MYNEDEIALSIIQSKVAIVVGHKGNRHTADLSSVKRRTAIMITVCMCATGNFVPSFVVFIFYNHVQNVDIIDATRINHMIIISLPSHSKHKLQLLDKTFMGLLKIYHNKKNILYLHHCRQMCYSTQCDATIWKSVPENSNRRNHCKEFQTDYYLLFKQDYF